MSDTPETDDEIVPEMPENTNTDPELTGTFILRSATENGSG